MARSRESLVREAFRAHPILVGLDDRALDDIWASGVRDTWPSGQTLSREGEPALFYWLLLTGSARVSYLSPDGFEVVVKLFGAPAAWAEMQVLTGKPHIENCVAVMPNPQAAARGLRAPARCPPAAHEERAPRYLRALLHLGPTRAGPRVSACGPAPRQSPARHVRMYGVDVDGGTGFRNKLNQSELAQSLGVARRSVTRIIGEWREQGIVSQRGHALIVSDLAALAALSSPDLVGVDWRAGDRLGGPEALPAASKRTR